MSDRDTQYSASESKRDPLGIRPALVDDLRVKIAALEDTLDLNNDEFARIAALDSANSEIRELCARARRRTVQTVPMIAQLESAERKLRICLRALDLLRRDSKSPDFVKVYCALIEDEVHSAGGGGAEQAGDEQGESKSGARSATAGDEREAPRHVRPTSEKL